MASNDADGDAAGRPWSVPGRVASVAALLLAATGWRVTLLERVPSRPPSAPGLLLHGSDLDPADLPDAALRTDLLRSARHAIAEDAAFAAWVLAAVRNQVGVEDGYVDTIGWLAWKTGKSRAELRKIVALAELCELLPATGAAWRAGRISTTAVELIAAARCRLRRGARRDRGRVPRLRAAR